MKIDFSELLLVNNQSLYILKGLSWLRQNGVNITLNHFGNEIRAISPNNKDSNIALSTIVKNTKNLFFQETLNIFELSMENISIGVNAFVDDYLKNQDFFKKRLMKSLYFLNDELNISGDIYAEDEYDPLHIEDVAEALKKLSNNNKLYEVFLDVAKNKNIDFINLVILEEMLLSSFNKNRKYNGKDYHIFKDGLDIYIENFKDIKNDDEKRNSLNVLSYLVLHKSFQTVSNEVSFVDKLKEQLTEYSMLDRFTFLESKDCQLIKVKKVVPHVDHITVSTNVILNNLKNKIGPIKFLGLVENIRHDINNYSASNILTESIAIIIEKNNVLGISLAGHFQDYMVKKMYEKNSDKLSIWIDLSLNYGENLTEEEIQAKLEDKINTDLNIFLNAVKDMGHKEIKELDNESVENIIMSKYLKKDLKENEVKKMKVKKF